MMKRILVGTFAIAALLLQIQLPAETFPHAFPRAGALPVFENDRVAIWAVTWHHDVAQPFHQHQHDMAGVYLRYGEILVTPAPGVTQPPAQTPPRPANQAFDVPRLLFQLAGIAHKEEGIGQPGDPERFAFQTDLKGYSPAYPPAPSGVPSAYPRQGARKDIDNNRVVFWDTVWEPGKPTGPHFHDKDRVEVFVTGGSLKVVDANKRETTQTVRPWSARFVPGNQVDSEEAIGTPVRAIVFELKTSTK